MIIYILVWFTNKANLFEIDIYLSLWNIPWMRKLFFCLPIGLFFRFYWTEQHGFYRIESYVLSKHVKGLNTIKVDAKIGPCSLFYD